MKRLSIIVLFVVFTPLVCLGQANLVQAPILRLAPDPISSGRGFTGVAQPEKVTAIYWNPAGLAFQHGSQIGLYRFKPLPDFVGNRFYGSVMGRYRVDNVGMFALSFRYLDLGSGTLFDDEGNPGHTFSSYQYSFGLSIGRVAIPKTLSLGIGIRFISSHLVPAGMKVDERQTKVGRAVTFDIGALYFPGDFPIGDHVYAHPSVGLSITNFGGRLTYFENGYENPLPTMLRLGGAIELQLGEAGIHVLTPSIEFSKLLVHVDSNGTDGAFQALFSSWSSYQYFNGRKTIEVGLLDQIMYGVGLEYWYANMIALRAGYYRQSEVMVIEASLHLEPALNITRLNLMLVILYHKEKVSPEIHFG